MIYITRREHFNAAHRLFRPDFNDEKNLQVFGKCSNPNWHGHNYTLFVTVRGEVDPSTGFLVNLKDLSALIETQVLEKLNPTGDFSNHKQFDIESAYSTVSSNPFAIKGAVYC